mgnify:CR=1 FL=1
MTTPENKPEYPTAMASEIAMAVLEARVRPLLDGALYAEKRERTDLLNESLGPDLSPMCRGNYCPALGQLALAYNNTKRNIARGQANIEFEHHLLESARTCQQIGEDMAAIVIDNIAKYEVLTEFHEIFMNTSSYLSRIRDRLSEGRILQQIETTEQGAALDKEKLARLKATLDSLQIENQPQFNLTGLLVQIRKALNRQPRDGECFGPKIEKLDNLVCQQANSCTNSKVLEALSAAVDVGLVKSYL